MRKALFTVCGLFLASSEVFGVVNVHSLLQRGFSSILSKVSPKSERIYNENFSKKIMKFTNNSEIAVLVENNLRSNYNNPEKAMRTVKKLMSNEANINKGNLNESSKNKLETSEKLSKDRGTVYNSQEIASLTSEKSILNAVNMKKGSPNESSQNKLETSEKPYMISAEEKEKNNGKVGKDAKGFRKWQEIMQLEDNDERVERLLEDSAEREKYIRGLKKTEELRKKNFKFELENNDTYTAHYLSRTKRSDQGLLGEVQIVHKYGAVTIHGWFFDKFLDLSYPVKFKVANHGQSYTFKGVEYLDGIGRKPLLLSVDWITKISSATSCDRFAYLKFGGENKGLIVGSESFYIGDIKGDQATGKGILITNTGKISCGEFRHGFCITNTDDMVDWVKKIFFTLSKETVNKN